MERFGVKGFCKYVCQVVFRADILEDNVAGFDAFASEVILVTVRVFLKLHIQDVLLGGMLLGSMLLGRKLFGRMLLGSM